MTTRTLTDSLRDFIARRRVLAMRRTAIEQIARQPGHLAADVNVPRRHAPAGITVVIVSCQDKLFEILLSARNSSSAVTKRDSVTAFSQRLKR